MSSLSNNELFTTTCWTRSSIQIYEKKKICHPLNRRSCEIFHAWPLSPTPFIFLSFSLAFHCISIFLISSKQIVLPSFPNIFPQKRFLAMCLQSFLGSLHGIISRGGICISKTFFVPSSERNVTVSRKYSSEFPNFLRIKRFNVQITQTNKYNNDNERMEKNIQLNYKISRHVFV